MTRLWRLAASLRGPERGISEAEGFSSFYEDTYPGVLRYLAHKTGDAQVALDLTAEAYTKAFEKRGRFRGSTREEALGWVWAIARNELRMYWRTRSVELSAVERLEQPRPAADDAELARIDELLAIEQQAARLQEALDELPSNQQDVIRMHVIEERDHAEIARELAVSTDVVRARLSRGLRRLAASMRLTERGR